MVAPRTSTRSGDGPLKRGDLVATGARSYSCAPGGRSGIRVPVEILLKSRQANRASFDRGAGRSADDPVEPEIRDARSKTP
ncbi:MAG: hypothetical protein CL933_17880 [Deltaproteobacteria bacterium]|nr:hypothetical protein [Deltaproteobacteria bacterium]